MQSSKGGGRNVSAVTIECWPTRDPGRWEVFISSALGKSVTVHIAEWYPTGAVDRALLDEIGEAAKIATMSLVQSCCGYQPALFGEGEIAAHPESVRPGWVS
jgi:hypothetical protein